MESSSSSSSGSDYTTVWSAPLKKPSGRTKFKETRHPVYRGVRRRGTQNRWVCEARNPNNKLRIWLGTFRTAEMAARAHDVAVMFFRGRSTCLNFADSAWLISVPSSFSSVQELKKEAVRIAEELHSSRNSSSSSDDQDTSVSASSSGETIDETEVISYRIVESKSNLAPDYRIELDFDADGDVNFQHYYASLAEGLMMEPPVDWFADLDDSHWGVTVSLWS